jgi:hypothetical protein
MPTRTGDVVVVQRHEPVWYSLFTVTQDGQQQPALSGKSSAAFGKQAALVLAKMMALEHVGGGTIFLCESGAGTATQPWTNPA